MQNRRIVDALERLVVAAVALTTRSLSTARADLDLTLAQWRVLMVLSEAEDGATISQVAGRIGVTLPATSRQLRRMARRGLVEIGRDHADRRAARVRLTHLGRTARDDVVRFRRTQLATAAAALRLDPLLATQLARIADAVDHQGEPSSAPAEPIPALSRQGSPGRPSTATQGRR